MNPANAANIPDLLGIGVGFVLTIMVFSYVLGDNPLFRLALSIFVGAAAGYAAVAAAYQIIMPVWQNPATIVGLIIPFLLGLLMFTKVSPSLARLGNPVLAYLVGVGAATAIGGAILGTIFPQVAASANLFDMKVIPGDLLWKSLVNGSIILVGTLSTLVYFHFGARARPDQTTQRQFLIEGLGKLGQVFIAITFGVLFAGVYTAALTAFIERWSFLINTLFSFFQ